MKCNAHFRPSWHSLCGDVESQGQFYIQMPSLSGSCQRIPGDFRGKQCILFRRHVRLWVLELALHNSLTFAGVNSCATFLRVGADFS